MSQQQLDIAIDLDDLEPLAKEYLIEIGGNDDLNVKLTLSSFIAWLRQRERQSVAETDNREDEQQALYRPQ